MEDAQRQIQELSQKFQKMTEDIAKPLQRAIIMPLQRSSMLYQADCIAKHADDMQQLESCQKKAAEPMVAVVEAVGKSSSSGGLQVEVQQVQQRCVRDLQQSIAPGSQPTQDDQSKLLMCMRNGMQDVLSRTDVSSERARLVSTCEEALAPFSGWPSADITGAGGGLGSPMTGTGWAAAKSGDAGSSRSSFGLW